MAVAEVELVLLDIIKSHCLKKLLQNVTEWSQSGALRVTTENTFKNVVLAQSLAVLTVIEVEFLIVAVPAQTFSPLAAEEAFSLT